MAGDAALLAGTTACSIGSAKLMRTTDSNSRGSRMRAVYWLRKPWPHMILYEAQIATIARAPLAMSCTLGSKAWMVELDVKSWPVSKSVGPWLAQRSEEHTAELQSHLK